MVGGGLLIVLKIDENDKYFSKYFLLLFALTGIVIAIFGAILQTTHQVFFSTGRGPVEGWQLIATGLALTIVSAWLVIKKKK